MACKKQAKRGGYSILSSIKKNFIVFKKMIRILTSILKKEFFFEKEDFISKINQKYLKNQLYKFLIRILDLDI